MRLLALWCPDWPITAAGYGRNDVVAVIEQRVIAASKSARVSGVRVGMRRREAESHGPNLVIVQRDEAKESRCFEPVVAALSTLTPLLEVIRPGLCAVDVQGVSRYFGGEEAVCAGFARTAREALALVDAPDVHVGIADGVFAATLAAKGNVIVPRTKTPTFLSPFPIASLGLEELTDTLILLGITTLGDFARLPKSAVSARFGVKGAIAHERARGESHEVLRFVPSPEDFTCSLELDVPIDRVDQALFAARQMASSFVESFARRGLGCSRVVIEAETEHTEVLSRHWRAEYVFDAESLIQRLRWQLDGWLSGTTSESPPTAGVTLIRFQPDEVVASTGECVPLFGARTTNDRRATKGAQRLIGLLGEEVVFTGVIGPGRSPAERSLLSPFGEPQPTFDDAPWPGRHPRPHPSVVWPDPIQIAVNDAKGKGVSVSGRGLISAAPATATQGGHEHHVIAWSGPWVSDERFWDPIVHHRRARFQLLLATGAAHLCCVEHSQWFIEATYD